MRDSGEFERDDHAGGPRLLFIGLGESTHTHAWIGLLEGSGINVRLFALPTRQAPPDDFPVRTYVNAVDFGFNSARRRALYPTRWASSRVIGSIPGGTANLFRYRRLGQRKKAESRLAQVIRRWRPHVIHTLGIDPAAHFYYGVRKAFGLDSHGRWVIQTRGGSDLELVRHDAEAVARIVPMVADAHHVLSDNPRNFQHLHEMGITEDKMSPLRTVPGTGGVDIANLSAWKTPPSERRLIIWPKAYDCPWSKAVPVLEALKLAWNDIQPCRVVMLAVSPEVSAWIRALPTDMRAFCEARQRIPHVEALDLMKEARVMLAPSLIDGTPNTMFEAMAAGALPILSPLETLKPLVRDAENVLFAENLYPGQIADALRRAMTDDALAESAAENNLGLVRTLADRATIGPRVADYYRSLCESAPETDRVR